MKALTAALAAFLIVGAAPAALAAGKTAKAAPAAKAEPAAPSAPLPIEPLAAALQSYAAFQADIDLVNGGSIQGPKDIERALDKAAALDRDSLTRGFIAYGALTAARNQQFVDEVRKVAAAYGKDRVLNALIKNGNYAGTITGGSTATEYVIRAAAADAARVAEAGDRVKSRAREAQNLKWGKALSGAAAPRMTRLKQMAAASAGPGRALPPEQAERLKIVPGDPSSDPASFGGAAFWRTFANNASTATLTSLPTQTQNFAWADNSGGASIRSSMLTLAAMYALDATQDRPAATDAALNDRATNGCLRGAQLQFYQCVATAHFNYENMACIGEAGFNTVAGCFSDAAK
ncbi:MAG: hypothetical protein AB7M12_10155 [Hyphomonadaceae bacterium]